EHPADRQAIRPGRIYIAPPDMHLLIEDGRVRLGHGPRENGHRPAVDPLFRTAARWYGERVVRIILSGSGDDGTGGLEFIKKRGGFTIVQDPADSFHPQMPRSGLENVDVDACLPAAEIPLLLMKIVQPGSNDPGGPRAEGDEMNQREIERDKTRQAE